MSINVIVSPDGLWFFWPLMGWGIAVALHALRVFGAGRWFGADWEERKIDELMEQRREPMKIVAVCGSPHKGSCYSVLSTIADNHSEIDYKLIMLGELDLKPCRGCYACIAHGEEK